MYFGAYPISLVSMAVGSYQTIGPTGEEKKNFVEFY
jgi:hypothetical protein